MATAILLFNGLHFPLAMIDKGIAWATKTGGSIIALFLVSNKEQEESYPFPNDLQNTEDPNAANDARGNDFAIIASNIHLMQHQAMVAKVNLETHILSATTNHELREWLEKAELIFVTRQPIDPSVLSFDPSKIKTALAEIAGTIEWITE